MIRVLYGSGVDDHDPQLGLVNEFEVLFVLAISQRWIGPFKMLMSTAEVLILPLGSQSLKSPVTQPFKRKVGNSWYTQLENTRKYSRKQGGLTGPLGPRPRGLTLRAGGSYLALGSSNQQVRVTVTTAVSVSPLLVV